MTIHVELDPETEARLKAQAERRGIAPEQYAREFLRENLPSFQTSAGKLTREELRAAEFEAAFRLLPDNPAVHTELRRLLVGYHVSGTQVHDARLVAAMHIHGVKRILTFNTKDFARFTNIQAVYPTDLH